ncbi:mechanosensitive ion channel family protein [Rubrivirga sp.]|uniref:mechanosensitive ion channel family protein n=1 Tax=Rubrivirga sp. TaxID=1885344 RepID=UPI003C766E1E
MQADSLAVAADTAAVQPINVSDAATGLVGKVEGWIDTFVLYLPNLVVAVLIVILAAFLARVARRVVQALLHKVTDRAPQARNVVDLLGTLAYIGVLAAGTFIALGVLNLTGVVTTLLAGAGIVGLALGFAFQDIAANFIAGVLMAVRNPFLVGEIIETSGFTGTVEEITLRSTLLKTFQGQLVILPNAKVYGDPIVNYSRLKSRRVDLACGVGYGDDLGHAQQVALDAVDGLEVRNTDRPVQLYYTEFGDSSVNFTVRFWIDFRAQTDFLDAQSQAIMAVKDAFDQNGVTIPFPIRTLDFDPNGGVALRAALKGTGGGLEGE